MFSKSFAVVFAAAAVASVSALGIETPTGLTQCGSVDITWSGKKAPFILSVLPSCDSKSDDPLLELPPMNATTYKWTVNMPSSTGAIAFAITDAEGNEAYTDEVTIRKSDDAACLNAAASSSSASASASASASVTGSASSVAATEVPRTTLTVSSSAASPSAPVNIGGSAGTGSGSSSSSSNDNTQNSGAVAHAASMFAGVIGLATGLLALF